MGNKKSEHTKFTQRLTGFKGQQSLKDNGLKRHLLSTKTYIFFKHLFLINFIFWCSLEFLSVTIVSANCWVVFDLVIPSWLPRDTKYHIFPVYFSLRYEKWVFSHLVGWKTFQCRAFIRYAFLDLKLCFAPVDIIHNYFLKTSSERNYLFLFELFVSL